MFPRAQEIYGSITNQVQINKLDAGSLSMLFVFITTDTPVYIGLIQEHLNQNS